MMPTPFSSTNKPAEAWKPSTSGVLYRQGYLSSTKERVARVRIAVVNSGNSIRFVMLQSVVPTNYETITFWDIQDDGVWR
jgi:hypothetical protein